MRDSLAARYASLAPSLPAARRRFHPLGGISSRRGHKGAASLRRTAILGGVPFLLAGANGRDGLDIDAEHREQGTLPH